MKDNSSEPATPVLKKRGVIHGIRVAEAMQRQVVQLPDDIPVRQCIRHIIKHKTNAVMVTAPDGTPLGVVSKTDIMGAYYAELPVETPISHIMVGPPNFCHREETLESAIDRMQTLCIHQLYVRSDDDNSVVGMLSYSDIVGLLYRYCRHCMKSGRCARTISGKKIPRLTAADVMTREVTSCHADLPLIQVIEILSEKKMGAILVTGKDAPGMGIISKTDLLFAYARRISTREPAHTIMNTPVNTCLARDLISKVIQQMLLFDIQRIFVRDRMDGAVTGVLSLSDATRFRSGTCKACGAGRVLTADPSP